ncbi:MAG: S8 family serine peptidase, partial [Mediterranea sp.]|nr:S8 family serine peptidase [Mediterranea sp.]
MRKYILSTAIALCLSSVALAQFTPTDTLKYRISLTDKQATTYSLRNPEQYLSAKAIERRKNQGLSIDSTDLPVCKTYVDAIRRQGVHVLVTGKWDNFVTVSCNDSTLIGRIAQLPFVRSTERVWKGQTKRSEQRDSLANKPMHTDNYYGPAAAQIELCGGQKLHQAGFRGQGMTIAVIDAGFHNVDKIEAMRNIHILGTHDFVNPQSDIYAENSHGTAVLSCMAMNQPNVMVGTAPEASYWLLRSEDDYSENLVEQDYWAAAIEFADSVGVDVVNTSLGYYTFDDPTKNYRYRDLDGTHTLMSRQASRAAD